MFVKAQNFLYRPTTLLGKLNPFFRKRKKIVRQYLNIESLKKSKRENRPDLLIVDGVSFQGIGKVPQIETINNNLLQRKNILTPYISYKDGKKYSLALFGDYFTKVVNLTEKTYCLETQIKDISILSVILSKRKKTRLKQLDYLETMIERNIQRKYLIIGDFNVKKESELFPLLKTCGLLELRMNSSMKKNKNRFFRVLYHNDIRVVGQNIIDCDFSKHGFVIFDFD